MPPQTPIAPVGLPKADFVKRYWFTPLQMVKVKNAEWHINRDTGVRSSQDYHFMSEGRHFMLPANSEEEFVGPIANAYLKGMASTLAQADNRLEALADFMFVAEYYNRLIVDVRDLAPEYNPVSDLQLRAQQAAEELPPWMQKAQAQPTQLVPDPATPPWEAPLQGPEKPLPGMEPKPVPQAVPTSQTPKAPAKPKEETKQFELNGITFKSVVDATGDTRYYKNNVETDAASYSKAASMI